MSPRFRFDLDPELQRRLDEKEAAERKLASARLEEAAAVARQDLALRKIEATRQRIARARDDLSTPAPGSPRRLGDQTAHFQSLGRALSMAEEELRGIETDRRSKEHRRLTLEKRLDELQAGIRSLERLRDKRLEEWQRAAEAAAERARDEDAQIGWSHRRLEEKG